MTSRIVLTSAFAGSLLLAASGFLLSSVVAANALRVPNWQPEDICSRDSARGQCLLLERKARNDVTVSWGLLPDAVRTACLTRFQAPLEPSWRILGDCIEIEGRRAFQVRFAEKQKEEEAALGNRRQSTPAKATAADDSVSRAEKPGTLVVAQADNAAERQRIDDEEASFLKTLEAQRKADAEAARLKAEAKKAAEAKAAEAERQRVEAEEASFLKTLEAQRKADAEAARLKAEAKKAAEARAAEAERQRVEAEEASFLRTLEAQRKADAEAARLKAEAKKAAEAKAAEAARQEAEAEKAAEAQRKAEEEAARLRAEAERKATLAAAREKERKEAEARAAADRERIENEEASFLKTLEEQRKADAEAARLKAEAKKAAEAKAAEAERLKKAEEERRQAEAAKAARAAAAKSCENRLKQVDATGTIQFQLNSAELDPAVDTTVLDNLAGAVADCEGELSIVVEGHTDALGSVEGNNRLSQARAETVAAYLKDKGVAADRITARGLGSSKPIASNRTREGRIKNRRIEFKVE
jgi:outer membrane protein OmpA-like peptidoglycan-associated protein